MPTVVIAAEAVARAGSEAQKRLIADIIEGELIIAFAYQEQSRRFDAGAIELEARDQGGGWVLNGTKMFVEFAAAADRLLVVARTFGQAPSREGLTMFLVDAGSEGIIRERTPTMARDHHYKVVFDGVKVPKDGLLGELGQAWSHLEPVIEKAAVVWSGFSIGVAEQMHEYANQFAKDRVQFSRPIGQMQLIQNYLASAIIEIYGAEALAFFTAFNLDKGRRVRDYVAKTKVFCAEVVKNTTDVGSQIFGGSGYMEEQSTTQYLRRGHQYKAMLGGTDYWEGIVAEELLDGPV
jgi:alkylation response protein AidB-like acyl-CoA dehydrogenase